MPVPNRSMVQRYDTNRSRGEDPDADIDQVLGVEPDPLQMKPAQSDDCAGTVDRDGAGVSREWR